MMSQPLVGMLDVVVNIFPPYLLTWSISHGIINAFVINYRFSGIFVNMGLTFQKADAQADLDWWSRNHGTGMLQNWPMFEVLNVNVFVAHILCLQG